MNLGQEQKPMDDTELFRLIYQTAQKHYPEKTAEFDKFVQEQATKYGIEYSKLKAETGARTLFQNPLFWLGAGLITSWLANR